MKQAILIVAYRDVDFIIKLVKSFNENDYIFLIHINVKSKLSPAEIDKFTSVDNIKLVSRRYKTYWGSMNHLRAILLLAKESLKYDVEYVHLISGQDFPIKSGDSIKSFLMANQGKQFLNYFKIPDNTWADENGGMDRLQFFHFNDYINAGSRYGRLILKILFFLQKKLNLKRKWDPNFPELYGGETWWTLSRDCLKYVVEYDRANFLHRFHNTRIPEELFFQTLLLSSPFKDDIINDNYRYINWEWKNGSRPAILDETDRDSLKRSKDFFARKFIEPTSTSLIEQIKKF